MRKIKTLIVDDEELACEGIATMLAADTDVEIVGTCTDGLQALNAIQRFHPDLVYLDVQMPLLNGFETLERLPPGACPKIIFVTAYDGYAVRAFEAGAIGYLLKPFPDGRFSEALARAKQQIRDSALAASEHWPPALPDLPASSGVAATTTSRALPATSRIAFKIGSDYLFVGADEIVWVKAEGEFVQVCAGGQIHRVREPLHEVERRLNPAGYARIHRSFIVNVSQIRRIAPNLYGDYTVAMSDGTRLRLSRTHRHTLKALLPDFFA